MVKKNKKTAENEEQIPYLKSLEVDNHEEVVFTPKKKHGVVTKSRVCLALLIIICLTIAIVGIVLITKASKKPEESPKEVGKYSEEAKRVGLKSFFEKMWKEGMDSEDYTYDPSPMKLKEQTDRSMRLLKELNDMDVDTSKLKLREKKAIEQAKHFLQHVFGAPYDANYYAGDWMLGPNTFCWQHVCEVGKIVSRLLYSQDKDYNLENIRKSLEKIGKGFDQYVENMKYGVKAGMVRSDVECKGGFTTLQRQYFEIALKGEEGVLEESFVQDSFKAWMSKYNDSLPDDAVQAVKEYLVKYIGRPIVNMFNYIEKEHIRHCVPTYVSSGLGTLPLNYVFTDGVKDTSQPTTKKLPTGEQLSGKDTYKLIMPYFTTNDMTPEEVHNLGRQMVDSLYNEIIDFAKNYTGLTDPDSAATRMKKELNSSSMFFADSFPKEEYGKDAELKCISIKTAKEHCPKRWAAVSKWMKLAREVTNLIESKITHLFYFTEEYKSVPTCPVQLDLDFNPISGVQSYSSPDARCSTPASYYLPFWSERPGPIYEEWSINSHEARPGHHLQVQGYIENFLDAGKDIISILDSKTYYTAFTEGWALYAESPLVGRDTDLYDPLDAQVYKYGMLVNQMWRALRLVVDTGFHRYGYKRDWARKLFKKYAWLEGDQIEKELTRYQSNFGQATAYMIGQLHIYKLRNYTQQKLGKMFDMKDFHYQVLSQGSAPLSYLEKQIKKFVECKKEPDESGCDEILSSPEKRKSEQKHFRSNQFDKFNPENHHRRHYF